MIYRMVCDIAANLAARLYPVAVSYDSELVSLARHSSLRINVRRDTRGGDAIEPMIGFQRNPRGARVRLQGVEATIIARSEVSGARLNEHEHECDNLVDALISEIVAWGVQARAPVSEFPEARYLDSDEYAGLDVGSGVAYRLRFRVSRAITARDYTGAGQATVALPGQRNTTLVTLDGVNYEEI